MSKAKPKRKVEQTPMRVQAYVVLQRAVEEGISYGWQRAHKHTEKPSQEALQDAIHDAVMNAIAEVFSFEDAPTDEP